MRKTQGWWSGVGTLQGATQGEGWPDRGERAPSHSAETWQRAGQATPSHPGAGQRRGFGDNGGGRAAEKGHRVTGRDAGSARGRTQPPAPSPEFPPREALTPITTLSSPWKMGMNLSPRRISAWFRGRNRQSTLMLHSLLVSVMVGAGWGWCSPRAAEEVRALKEGAQRRPRRRTGAGSLGPRKVRGRPGEGWGAGPGRTCSLLRQRDAGDLGVGSSPGALPLRPSRCSAALRAWAGRRPRGGAGLPSRGDVGAAPGPSRTVAPFLPVCLLFSPLTLEDNLVLTPSLPKLLTASRIPDLSVPPPDSTPLKGIRGLGRACSLSGEENQEHFQPPLLQGILHPVTILSPNWEHPSCSLSTHPNPLSL